MAVSILMQVGDVSLLKNSLPILCIAEDSGPDSLGKCIR